MDKTFTKAVTCSGDAWLMDYTEQTDSARGVEIHFAAPTDIEAMHLKNPRCMEYLAVNFEEHLDFFRCADGSTVSNCEAMFVSTSGTMPWLLLAELKYGLEKNARKNTKEAKDQLLDTLDHLRLKGLVSETSHNFYMNSCSPGNSAKEPFLNFKKTQLDKLEAYSKQGYKINVLGYNDLLILSQSLVLVPKKVV